VNYQHADARLGKGRSKKFNSFAKRASAVAGVVGLVASGVLAVALVAASPAAALPGPAAVAEPGPNNVTADALPTVQIDGVVWSQAVVGNTVYAGGSFSRGRRTGNLPDSAREPAGLQPDDGCPHHFVRALAQRPGEVGRGLS
jgi:hypothetical protein